MNAQIARSLCRFLAAAAVVPVTFGCAGPSSQSAPPVLRHGEAEHDVTHAWGDQGDGTYLNPYLDGDFADVDVERHGDRWYMITSTNHLLPGMTILQSKDLVNWGYVGHVWDKLDWRPAYNWDQMNGYGFGVWAGDFAYNDGTWYCYVIDPRKGLIMSSAPHISGPWTEPHVMLEKTGWTDPAVYWDQEERQAYLVANYGNVPGKGHVIKLHKMSWDGRKLLDDGVEIHHGEGTEAAKIYKVNGRWYIFLAQWFRPDPRRTTALADTDDRKQLVLRSTTGSIYGPYEQKIVFERGNGVIRSACQGALMQTDDGKWWYTHQLIQNTFNPFQGRPQMLQPVEWIDGWPMIGQDVDGDGVGEPVHGGPMPVTGRAEFHLATDDDFEAETLGAQWNWNHNPRNDFWSLSERPGFLRLKAAVPVKTGGFWNAANTLSQRILGRGWGVATVKLDLSSLAPHQHVGLCRFSDPVWRIGVEVDGSGVRRLVFVDDGAANPNRPERAYRTQGGANLVDDASDTRIVGPEINGDDLWLRTINDGPKARFEYSTDGRTWKPFGYLFTLEFGKWRGDRLGVYCWNDEQPAGHVDVDYFHYDYEGERED